MAPINLCPITPYSFYDAINKCKNIVQILRSLRRDRIDYQTRIHHYIHQCRLLKQEMYRMCKLPTKVSLVLPRMVRQLMHICVRLRVLYQFQSEVDGKLYCLGDILSQCQASLVDKIHRVVVPT